MQKAKFSQDVFKKIMEKNKNKSFAKNIFGIKALVQGQLENKDAFILGEIYSLV
jgi:hypothetical protein